jgi:hypothetical protein
MPVVFDEETMPGVRTRAQVCVSQTPDRPEESRANTPEDLVNAKSTPGVACSFIGSVPVPAAGEVRSPGCPSGLFREIVVNAGASLSAAAFAALLLARLLKVLAATHFLFHAGVLNQLPKPADCFLN